MTKARYQKKIWSSYCTALFDRNISLYKSRVACSTSACFWDQTRHKTAILSLGSQFWKVHLIARTKAVRSDWNLWFQRITRWSRPRWLSPPKCSTRTFHRSPARSAWTYSRRPIGRRSWRWMLLSFLCWVCSRMPTRTIHLYRRLDDCIREIGANSILWQLSGLSTTRDERHRALSNSVIEESLLFSSVGETEIRSKRNLEVSQTIFQLLSRHPKTNWETHLINSLPTSHDLIVTSNCNYPL